MSKEFEELMERESKKSDDKCVIGLEQIGPTTFKVSCELEEIPLNVVEELVNRTAEIIQSMYSVMNKHTEDKDLKEENRKLKRLLWCYCASLILVTVMFILETLN